MCRRINGCRAFGAHPSGRGKEVVIIERWSVKHFRLSSRNIIKDLKKNLARFGAAEDVTLINGRSSDKAIISEVRQWLKQPHGLACLFSTRTNNVPGFGLLR
jgi:hypothetical protein